MDRENGMARPTGITIFGYLMILWGGVVGSINAIFLALQGMAFASRFLGIPAVNVMSLAQTIGHGWLLFWSILNIVAGVGLLNLIGWARVMAVVLAGVNVAYILLVLLLSSRPVGVFPFRNWIFCAIDVLIVWYLSQPTVKEAFAQQAATTVPGWITGIRMRGRIKRELGRKATKADLTSLDTWMKADAAGQRSEPNKPPSTS
jgi:hypothetical protein